MIGAAIIYVVGDLLAVALKCITFSGKVIVRTRKQRYYGGPEQQDPDRNRLDDLTTPAYYIPRIIEAAKNHVDRKN